MVFLRIILLVSLLFLGIALPMEVRGDEPAGGGVTIKADSLSYDQAKDTYQATGNVELLWDGYSLYSDMASLRQGKSEAEATGKVKLVKGADTLTCERLGIDLSTETGEAVNGALFVKRNNFHLSGAKLSKVGEQEYRLENGEFTTCDGEQPSWKFTASDMDVTLDGFAKGQNATFYVGALPLFYFPYLTFPVGHERQSGFLFPRLGSSTQKGVFADIPYYWVISPSQEATFDLDIQTKRGVGTGFEYKYLRPSESKGDLRGYLIYDFQKNKERGNFVVLQNETISPSLSFKSDVDLALDRNFYRDYGDINGDYNRQYLNSTVALTWRRQTSLLNGELRYVDDLTADSNRSTLQKLPEISFTTIGEKLGNTPFHVAIASDFTNFYRGSSEQQGQRLELHPSATIYSTLPGGLDLTARGGYLVRLYNSYGGDAPNIYRGDGLADASLAVSSTLARNFDTDWGELRRLRHVLVPEVGYVFVQEKNQNSLPNYDFHDRVLGEQMLVWSLTNYFTGKFIGKDDQPVNRDVGWLRLSQGYQLSGSRRDLLSLVDEGHPYTDIKIEAKVTPASGYSLNYDSQYDVYNTRFNTNNVALELNDGKGNLFGLGYRYSRDAVDYIEGKLGVALVKPFIFHYTGRYSIDKGGFLESNVDMEYKHQCWSMIFSYRERLTDREFFVNFVLAGLGSVGRVRAL